MFKFKIVVITLSLCAAASAGITGGTVLPLNEFSGEQEKILDDAVSSFVSQINTEDFLGIIGVSSSLDGVGASAGFEIIETGIRTEGGKAFLSIEGSLAGVGILIEVEFGSLGDLFGSVGKSLVKTTKLIPYSYRRWINGEDIDFTDYFDVYEDQRPFTIKAIGPGGKMYMIYESRDSGLREFVYDGPPIIDFFNLPDSLNQLPWDMGKEVGRDSSIDIGGGVVSGTDPEPDPDLGIDPGTDPEPDPDPGIDPDLGTDPEPDSMSDSEVWNGFASSYILLPANGIFKPMFYTNTDSADVELVQDERGRFEGGVEVSAYTSYLALSKYTSSDNQYHNLEAGVENLSLGNIGGKNYDYVKWGKWNDNTWDSNPSVVKRIFSPVVVGIVTPLEDIPNSGTALYSGDMFGSYYNMYASPLRSIHLKGDVSLTADFSAGTINGGFVNIMNSDGSLVSDFDVSMSISDSGKVTGTMSGIFDGTINADFAGPEAEELFGGWKVSENGIEGAGFFAGKR